MQQIVINEKKYLLRDIQKLIDKGLLKEHKYLTGWEEVDLHETCYSILNNSVQECYNNGDEYLLNEHENGYVFTDEKLAADILRARNIQYGLEKLSVELSSPPDWEQRDEPKWYIYYDYDVKKLSVNASYTTRRINEIYFSELEYAKQAIEKMGNELIWYFTEYKNRLDALECKEELYDEDL